jgi:hypothetical protein
MANKVFTLMGELGQLPATRNCSTTAPGIRPRGPSSTPGSSSTPRPSSTPGSRSPRGPAHPRAQVTPEGPAQPRGPAQRRSPGRRRYQGSQQRRPGPRPTTARPPLPPTEACPISSRAMTPAEGHRPRPIGRGGAVFPSAPPALHDHENLIGAWPTKSSRSWTAWVSSRRRGFRTAPSARLRPRRPGRPRRRRTLMADLVSGDDPGGGSSTATDWPGAGRLPFGIHSHSMITKT